MRQPGVTALAAAAVAAAFALPAAAQAALPACSPVPTSYDSGGAPSAVTPNDPLFAKQWGLQQIKAPGAWARGALGAGTTIAIVDTGVDLNHPDLQPQLVPGADFVSEQNCTPGAQDTNGHGTHVAGIAAAATGNGIGVAGTAPQAKVMPVRVLDPTGSGYIDDIALGVRWAADRGAHVINLSLSDGLPLPLDVTGVSDAVAYAYGKGAVVVAAAGNERFPICEHPAASRYAVCVGATDYSGFPSGYSNFAFRLDGGVAVRAPGGDGSGSCGDRNDIWSTYWPAASGDDAERCAPKGYEPIAGTSMASPFVSGIAAMLRGAGLSNQQVMDCLKRTSSNRGSFDLINGYGLVNAEYAVATCAPGYTGAQLGGGSGQSTPSPTTTDPGTQGGVEGERAASDSTPPRIRLAIPSRTPARIARAGYISVRARVSENAKVALQLLMGRETAVAGRNATVIAQRLTQLKGGRTYTVRLRITRAGKRVLRKRRRLTVTLIALARDAANNNGTAIKEGRIRR